MSDNNSSSLSSPTEEGGPKSPESQSLSSPVASVQKLPRIQERCYQLQSAMNIETVNIDAENPSDEDSEASSYESSRSSIKSKSNPPAEVNIVSNDSAPSNFERDVPEPDVPTPPEPHPVPNDYIEHLARHRVAFNLKVFETDFGQDSPQFILKPKSKVISSARIDEIIDCLQNYDNDPSGYFSK